MHNPLNGIELYQEIVQKGKKSETSGEIIEEIEVVDPQPVEDNLLPVPAFPMEKLPKVFRLYINDVVCRKQCPPEYVAIPTLIMAASLIGKGCHIKPLFKDDWRVVPNLWGGVVGDPGSLKSPACSDALFPLKFLENNAYKIYEEQMQDYEEKMREYLSQKKYLDSKDKKARKQENKETLEEIANEYKELEKTKPKQPVLQRYKVGDITVEKLQDLLSESPRGLMLFRDELMGLLASFEKKGHETDRSFFLEAWDGSNDYPLERIMRGTVLAKEICLSLFGTTQPEKLESYLKRNLHSLGNDGLLQRFQLLVYPDSKSWKLMKQSPDFAAKSRFLSVCKELVLMDFVAHGANQDKPFYDGQDIKPHYLFSPAAQDFFDDWIQKLQIKIEQEKENIIKEQLSKYRSLMPSLALIDHLINIADKKIKENGHDSGDVPLDSAERAAALCDYLEAHARRIYGIVLQEAFKKNSKLSPADTLLAWMMRYYKKTGQTLFTCRFMLRHSKFRDSKSLKPVVADLLAMECLEPVNEKTFRLILKADANVSSQAIPETAQKSTEESNTLILQSLQSESDSAVPSAPNSTDTANRIRITI